MHSYPAPALARVEEMVRAAAADPARAVSFQGAPGANSHRAALEYDADLVMVEPRDVFPKEIEVGTVLQLDDDDGQTQLFQVVEIDGDQVTVDGNHPLAGVSLVFSATVENVRAATPEEMCSSVPDTSSHRN